ncbi:type II toxin-antitoxin system RelE/ParE family toxin [Gramella lutea]|uniref:Type II toxin-antitoxin system RelE/ParE family toxin n=1 Tax=Christiangramia lutea TaxID=1607951 RepID=A0A9X1V5X4_9FLAO|nr:type II toxin-antitoxin system RelE/ParE family toxin [Christiangramia lutea]MCH4824671.1 type II toxin-antitoxin system RelE/ParE family toxin [Christiangramia lutea]
MELTVYWTQLAEDKLEDIFHYYKYKASKRVAAKLINGIIDTTIDLEKTPGIGQKEFLLKAREQDFRYLVFKNYKIIYWINKKQNRIEIANVFDTRQNPEKIAQTR